MRYSYIATVLAATSGLFCARAQTQGGADYSRVREAVHAQLRKALDVSGTSVSYAVLQDGKPVLADAVGSMDASRQTPVSTETIYNLGSLSKVYTAAAIMQLAEEGKVGLDDPLVKHLPGFRLKDKRYEGITLRMLLNHASGMMGADYLSAILYGSIEETFREKTMEYWAQSALRAEPGKFSVYCNDCYIAAEYVVAQVSGMPFDAYVRKRIYEPLGLESAGFANRLFAPGTHAGIGWMPQEFVNVLGSGGVSSSVTDLARFGDAFLRGGANVLSPASVSQMNSPNGVTFIAEDRMSAQLGFGWDSVNEVFEDADLGPGVLSKSGGTTQFESHLYVVPKYGLAAGISATGDFSESVSTVLRGILRQVLSAQGIEVAKPLPDYSGFQRKELPAGFESEYAGYYAAHQWLLKVSVNSDQTLRLERSFGEEPVPFEEGLAFDGRAFCRSNGQPVYRFVEANGRKYILEGAKLDRPMMQKLEGTGIELGQWKARLGALYLPAEVDYRSVYVADGLRLLTIEGLEGLLFLREGLRIQPVTAADGSTTRPVLQIPGNSSRDLHTMTAEAVGGEEWLRKPAYPLRPASSIPQLDRPSVTLDESGANKLFRLPTAPVTFTMPADGRVMVYDEGGLCTFDSFAQEFDAALMPKSGFIRFLGAPGVTFALHATK